LSDEGFYIHHEQILGFSPEALEQANGNTRRYFYEFGILENDQELVQRVAIAYIPDSELAQNELTTWLSPLTPDETDSLLAKLLPNDNETFTCYTCFIDSPQDLKIIAQSLANAGDLVCVITYCDGTEATVTAPSLGGGYSVNVDFDWIISSGGSSSSSGGGGSSGDGSGSSSCPPPFVCGNTDQTPDQGDLDEEEEQNQVIPQPCEGDPVPKPEIAPQKNSGVNGGRQGKTRKNSDGSLKDHKGLDISTSLDAPIYSMYPGIVIRSGNQENGWGNWILMQSTVNNTDYYFLYAHLNSINILNNSSISAGTIIGTAGDSGNLAGAIADGYAEQHTHIEVREVIDGVSFNNSTVKNPEDFMNTKFDSDGNPIESATCNN